MRFEQFTDDGTYERFGKECWMIKFSQAELDTLRSSDAKKNVTKLGQQAGRLAFEQDIPINMVLNGLYDMGKRWMCFPFREAQNRGYAAAAHEWSRPDRVFRNADKRALHLAVGKDMDAVTARAESNPSEFMKSVLVQSILLEFDETLNYRTYPQETAQSVEATIDLVGAQNMLAALAIQSERVHA